MPPRKTKIFMWGEPKYLQRALAFTILAPFTWPLTSKNIVVPANLSLYPNYYNNVV